MKLEFPGRQGGGEGNVSILCPVGQFGEPDAKPGTYVQGRRPGRQIHREAGMQGPEKVTED